MRSCRFGSGGVGAGILVLLRECLPVSVPVRAQLWWACDGRPGRGLCGVGFAQDDASMAHFWT